MTTLINILLAITFYVILAVHFYYIFDVKKLKNKTHTKTNNNLFKNNYLIIRTDDNGSKSYANNMVFWHYVKDVDNITDDEFNEIKNSTYFNIYEKSYLKDMINKKPNSYDDLYHMLSLGFIDINVINEIKNIDNITFFVVGSGYDTLEKRCNYLLDTTKNSYVYLDGGRLKFSLFDIKRIYNNSTEDMYKIEEK